MRQPEPPQYSHEIVDVVSGRFSGVPQLVNVSGDCFSSANTARLISTSGNTSFRSKPSISALPSAAAGPSGSNPGCPRC